MWGKQQLRSVLFTAAMVPALTFVGCAQGTQPHASTLCAGPFPSRYFPEGALGENPRSDRFVAEWYSKQLSAMGEPSLHCVSRYPVYRFLWLRTFHHPIAVRVEKRQDGMHVFAVELDGAGGYEPGSESRRIERVLSAREEEVFNEAVASVRIFSAPDKRELGGADGSQWIVEARDGARYQIHDVWTPERGRIHQLGIVFIALTGWSIPKNEMY
jgi:hypothetical protein